MPSIIQAGNAASTGLVTTGATDGILELRSGTAAGGTVAMTINAAGAVTASGAITAAAGSFTTVTATGTILHGSGAPSSTVPAGSIAANGPNGVQLALSNTITSTFTGLVVFINGNGQVGNINTNGSSTTYNTSSDYRLKNITGSVSGAKDFVLALKPRQGTWKVDGSEFVGFVAHEFAEVSPLSVSGQKDAVDVDGKPIMQGMQAASSEVMANLVSLVQEQQAIIESLTTRLTTLEGGA